MVTDNAAFGKRSGHAGVVYNNKMWIIGGSTDQKSGGDQVFYSSDGKTWTEATSSAPWGNRNFLKATVHDDKMWVMGGIPVDFDPQNQATPSDVYSSTDGKTWNKETDKTAWSGRLEFGLIAFEKKMWLLGGSSFTDFSYHNDILSSVDGISWTQATPSAEWQKRAGAIVTQFGNKAMLIAGTDGNNSVPDDVWSFEFTTNTSPILHSKRENHAWQIHLRRSPLNNKLLKIDYYFEQTSPIHIRLFDSEGSEISTMMHHDSKAAGCHTILLEPVCNVRPGLYIVNLRHGEHSLSRQVVLYN